jgi:N-acetylmuramic acid 6-phosphate (MurNAc-6-P) etherase
MALDEINEKMKDRNLKAVSKATGIEYQRLRNILKGNQMYVGEYFKIVDYLSDGQGV